MFILFLALLAGTGSVYSSCQDLVPLSLPITDIPLSNGNNQRGVAGSIGTPPQDFSFMIHAFLNNTWVYNSSSPWCIDDTTKQQCYTQRGGLYDPTQSSSANFGLDVYAAGGEVHDTDRAAATHIWFNSFFEDTLRLGNASIDDFPLGMPGFDVGGRFDTQANLGLGQNSTLLSHLKESGRIASRTYSYWAGVGTATEGVTRDGALVLGGYDAAKVIGPNITGNLQPWSLGCPSGMYVTVNGMELNFPNGTNADMITPSVLTACLQVDFPYLITLPQIPYFRHFEAFTQTQAVANSEGIYWWAKGYYPGTAYEGDITFKLTSGFELRVPNEVFVVPEQSVASSGAIQTNNEMSLTLLSGTRNDNKDDTPIIGMPFFSSAYLMVDLDASTFTLWQANMTDNSNLIAIGADAGCTHSPPVSTNSTIDDAPPASSDEEALDNDQGSQDLGTGAVAGAAIGGLAAVIMLVVLAYFIIRRCRRQSKSGTVASDDTGASGQRMWDGHQRVDYDAYRYAGQYSEMPNEATRMEMSATQLHPHEIDSRQKMAELSHARFDNPVEMSSVQTPKLRPSRPR